MKYDSRKEEITKIVVHLAGFLHRLLIRKTTITKYLHTAFLPRIRYLAKQEKSTSQPWNLGDDVLFFWKNAGI